MDRAATTLTARMVRYDSIKMVLLMTIKLT